MRKLLQQLKDEHPTFGLKRLAKLANCSPNLVKYYLGDNQRELFSARQRNRRKNVTADAKTLCGGKCCVCDYDRSFTALEFHHIDTKCKEGDLATLLRNVSKEAFLKETEKCILVCATCHREIHDESITVIVE